MTLILQFYSNGPLLGSGDFARTDVGPGDPWGQGGGVRDGRGGGRGGAVCGQWLMLLSARSRDLCFCLGG